ncbi:3-oxoacyl-(acyl-carrier-protein) synthase/non-ribosomal peptide synthetase component F [Rhizobium mesoamericanum]|uniref:beta-ketoacyl synthase N-terminal-like domain-containing protein n=1 Tax=Rhizobium mesoamericanum TaxID=1079800 RepID=UPI0027877FAB|nr:beta-ketoacyl synthase N-terminal-like domain-containing protein [Rhizobium mesoamericanum]MDQ0564442.1 3-oxoacyl-(acyl-carrier-protein) synthase/non-ribosomal peptide synthetase component F [Rhizobium mesoamericanum]
MKQEGIEFALNSSQERMCFLDAIEPRRKDLNICCAMEMVSQLSTRQLHEMLLAILPQHVFLNARLVRRDGRYVWYHPVGADCLKEVVLPERACASKQQLPSLYAEFINQPSELMLRWPWRVQLVQCEGKSYLFCLFHHIICDGDRSLLLLLQSLSVQSTLEKDRGVLVRVPSAEPPTERDWEAVSRLAEVIDDLGDLRAKFHITGTPGPTLSEFVIVPNEQFWGHDNTEAALLAALQFATANLLSNEQIIVAIPQDCVPDTCSEFGYFGSPGLALMPPLIEDLCPGPGIGQLPQWALAQVELSARIGRVPYQEISALPSFAELGHADNLFDVLVVRRRIFGFSSPSIVRVFEPAPSLTPSLMVANHWHDASGRLICRLEAANGLINQSSLDYIAGRMKAYLLRSRSTAARPKDLIDFTATPATVPPFFLAALRRQAGDNPELAAIHGRRDSYSYQSLICIADQLTTQIRARIGEGNPTIAYAGPREPKEITALVGVNMAGGCFLRLDETDSHLRPEQLERMGADAILVTEEVFQSFDRPEGFAPCDTPIAGFRLLVGSRKRDPSAKFHAYVVMTSGSTGEPKAIRFPAAQLDRLVMWHLDSLPEAHRMAQLSSLMHDVAYHEIYATLAGGRTLVFVESELRSSPGGLASFVNDMAVDRIYLPTVLLAGAANAALEQNLPCRELRMVIVAGGTLEISDNIRCWFAKTGATLVNHYGMSETQDITANVLGSDPGAWPEIPHIGRPIAGAKVSVLGSRHEPLPPGVAGNLAVQFPIEQGFSAPMVLEDVGFAGDDGNIHLVGRSDRIVKLRGNRISLEAIESALRQREGILDAAAIAPRATAFGQELQVFFTCEPKFPEPPSENLVDYIVTKLGRQFRCRVSSLADMPRLKNGKIDYPSLERRTAETGVGEVSVAPQEQEAAPDDMKVAAAIRKLVPNARFTASSRFSDIGFDSLGLMSLELELSNTFPDLTVADFYRFPTVAALEAHLARAGSPVKVDVPRPVRFDGRNDDVSVVGMAGRFPGAVTTEALWENLAGGHCLITNGNGEAAKEEVKNRSRCFIPSFGRLQSVDTFDYEFFGISPAEAYRMDPQLRIFLELCWSALEHSGDAGYDADTRIGLFAGAGLSTYLMNELEPLRKSRTDVCFREDNTLQQRLGNDRNYLTSTVSYRLGLTGPSITIQAACATSLAAIHYARQALLVDECDIALAGGISVIWPQPTGYDYIEGSVRSPKGTCRPFDAEADGTVFGNGGGLVVLKRSRNAIHFGNTVYANIVGSAVNHDGSRRMSFAAPSPQGQADVITHALRNAGLGPDDLSFIEAHGTGTVVGDAIEWSSIAQSLRKAKRDAPCLVGSIKGNIGHLDEAAGIAGFIKSCLSLYHAVFPGTCHFRELNPRLPPDEKMQVTSHPVPLPVSSSLFGGVSAFGMGGTNVHMILQGVQNRGRP